MAGAIPAINFRIFERPLYGAFFLYQHFLDDVSGLLTVYNRQKKAPLTGRFCSNGENIGHFI